MCLAIQGISSMVRVSGFDPEHRGSIPLSPAICPFGVAVCTSGSEPEGLRSVRRAGAMREGMMYRNHLLVPRGQDVGLKNHHSKSGSQTCRTNLCRQDTGQVCGEPISKPLYAEVAQQIEARYRRNLDQGYDSNSSLHMSTYSVGLNPTLRTRFGKLLCGRE